MRTPMVYYGGKTLLADWIVEHLPEHGHYVEPFAGSLSVLLAKSPSTMETVNDIDGDLMTWWRVLRDRPNELARACALTPHSRAEHAVVYEPATDELEQARRVWVRLTQGRAGTLRRTGWRHYISPAGSSSSMPDYLTAYVDRIAPVAERLAAVSLECRPAAEIIAAYGQHNDVVLYVDPPYLADTRTSVNYRHEMSSEAQHRALAEQLRATRAAVVLSGYDSPLYRELYAGWDRVTRPAWTGQARTNGARTECLWSNQTLGRQTPLWTFAEMRTP